jgi:hypothetical protein
MVRLHRPRPPRPAPWLLALFGLGSYAGGCGPGGWLPGRECGARREANGRVEESASSPSAAGWRLLGFGAGLLGFAPLLSHDDTPSHTHVQRHAVYICQHDFFIMFGTASYIIHVVSVGKIVGQNGQAVAQEILLCWLAADAGLAPPPAPAPSTWRGWRYGCS